MSRQLSKYIAVFGYLIRPQSAKTNGVSLAYHVQLLVLGFLQQ